MVLMVLIIIVLLLNNCSGTSLNIPKISVQ